MEPVPTRRMVLLGTALGALAAACSGDDSVTDSPATMPPTTAPPTTAPPTTVPPTTVPPTTAAPTLDRSAVTARHAGIVPTEWGTDVTGVDATVADTSTADGPSMALTFDACGGPGADGVDTALLDLLERERLPATLFLNARWIGANPATVQRILTQPLWEVANHGTQHKPLSVNGRHAYGIAGTRSVDEVIDEVWANHEQLRLLTGSAPRWFRSGTAHYDEVATSIVAELGEQPVGFAVNGDAGATLSSRQVAAALTTPPPRSGAVVIMHMIRPGGGTFGGLAAALPALRERSTRFVTSRAGAAPRRSRSPLRVRCPVAPNRLANETSPYLRQHADNPVDWQPWGDGAFDEAAERDVPVLLSVGYSSCHWCHVMAHESFEDPDVAAVMNTWFVPIKVDREERPDIDAIYMEATQAMTGRGGWPMTVFMAPDSRPFYCGTYFPPERRGGMPGFVELMEAVHEAWTERRGELDEQAGKLAAVLGGDVPRGGSDGDDGALPGPGVLDAATEALLAALDAQWGGFGAAPKFPQTLALGHLLRHHRRTGSEVALQAVTTSLDAMASGGMVDLIGGGFSRYSVDERWLVPHFEKMLYDNALLTRAYTHAHQVTGDPRYGQVVAETLEYVLRDLSHPEGGRYSAEDADSLPSPEASHAEEGAFYTFTPDEVAGVLAAAELGDHVDAACAFWGITPAGNFEGRSIPNRLHARGQWERPPEIEAARAALARARARRPRPGLDDKVLTEWNALWVTAAAEAGAAFGRAEWVAEAERTAEFLCSHLRPTDRWLRSWQAGAGARHLAYGSDHAALVEAFLALQRATGRQRWLTEAVATADTMLALFWDHDGGIFTTGEDAEALLVRPREVMDNATPSATSTAAVTLLQLEALTGEGRYGEHARQILRALGPLAGRVPLGFGQLLAAVHAHVVGMTELVITGDRPDLVAVALQRFTPATVVAWGERGDGPLWEGRHEEGSDGRAYVCRHFTCEAPVGDPEALAGALDR